MIDLCLDIFYAAEPAETNLKLILKVAKKKKKTKDLPRASTSLIHIRWMEIFYFIVQHKLL